MKPVVIFGAGTAARMMRAYLEREGRRVAGFTVDEAFRDSAVLDGLPVFAWETLERDLPPDAVELIGPVSHHDMNRLRRERHRAAKARGYALASFIHPSVQNHADHVGEAAIILECCAMQPGVRIGDGVICWTGTLIGHDTAIADYCFLSGAVAVSARVRLGERCYLAFAARISTGVTLGEACAVLNGAFVAADLPDRAVVKGEAARKLRVTTDRVGKLF